jgi:hypothetical protein
MTSAHEVELRREASVMALYVAVCLLAALIALGEDADHGHVRAFGLVWGTTLGLALAHAFAFRISARLTARGRFSSADAQIVLAQLAGATFVALIATLPVVMFDSTGEFDVVRTVLSIFIGAMGYAVGRLSGGSRTRSLVYGGIVLLLAVVIALIKNTLSGH